MTYFDCLSKENRTWGLIAEQILLGQINPIKYIDYSGRRFKPKISAIIIDKSSKVS